MSMTNSKLATVKILSPNCSKPRNHKIDTITIHHMAGNCTVESCGEMFKKRSRGASSNYGIGTDGRIALYVDEANRSWCSSNSKNDNRAVTIEVANSTGAPKWEVSQKAMESLIALCVDICKRNSIKKLNFTGNTKGNLTMHKWFSSTNCPGPYLESKFPYIASEVNKRLGTQQSAAKNVLYRVRKTWADEKSQKGAFESLANAKKCADQNSGYFVFDQSGKKVYPTTKKDHRPNSQGSHKRQVVKWGREKKTTN